MILAAGQAAGFVIGMAGSAFLARLLGPEGRGTFELLVLMPNLAVLLLRGGVVTGAVYRAGADGTERLRLAAVAMGLTALLGILGALLGVAVTAAMPSLPVPRVLLLLAFTAFPFFLWISNARELLNGLGRFGANAFSIVSERLLLTILLALAFVSGVHALAPLFGLYLASVAAVAVLLGVQLRIRPILARGADAARILDYGARSALAPILIFLHMRLDQMVLGWSGASHALGLYVIAVTIAEVFLPLPDAIYSALYPRLMRAGADRADLAARASRLSHGCLVLVALGMGIVARPVVAILFGEQFLTALAFVPFLLAARLMQSGSSILRASLLAEGRPLQASLITAAGLAANALGLFWLIPRHGALGAAMAALLSAGIEYALTLLTASRQLARSPITLLIPLPADIASLRSR